jgi:endo-1,4-beta-xylanase
MIDRRNLLALALSSAVSSTMSPTRTAAAAPGLGALAAARGLHFGAAVTARQISSMPDIVAAVETECSILVAENEMKWHVVEHARGKRETKGADAIVAFAAERGMAVRGHTLVWPTKGRLPAWVESWPGDEARDLEAVLVAHVTEMTGRYRGRIASWDAVNEGIEARDGRVDGLRRSVLLDRFDERYFDITFAAARAADPGARLAYNDYGIEHQIPWQVAKRRHVLDLLQRLVRRGVPVDTLGIQSHLTAAEPFDAAAFGSFLDEVAAMGLAIEITELDVNDRRLAPGIEERDRISADLARRYLDTCLARPAVRTVLTWGLSDRTSWINAPRWGRGRADGLPSRPLPLDEALARKPMWHAIAAAIAAAPAR